MCAADVPNDAVKMAIRTSGKNNDGNQAWGKRNVPFTERRASDRV